MAPGSAAARYAGEVTRKADQTWGFRLEPREWRRLAGLVRANPGDVTLGARVFFAIGGHDEEPAYRRFLETPTGRHLVENAIGYPDLFTDYERLRALPPGSLGREYVRDLDDRGIDPLELDQLTQAAYEGRAFSREHAYVRDRVRHAHDLLHTLTGYGVDVFGEAGVLAFTYAQTGNKGWAGLVLLNGLTAVAGWRLDGWRVAWKGYRRGRQARYLPAVDDWERLLQLPIEEARAELKIPPLEPYAPMALGDVFRFASDAH